MPDLIDPVTTRRCCPTREPMPQAVPVRRAIIALTWRWWRPVRCSCGQSARSSTTRGARAPHATTRAPRTTKWRKARPSVGRAFCHSVGRSWPPRRCSCGRARRPDTDPKGLSEPSGTRNQQSTPVQAWRSLSTPHARQRHVGAALGRRSWPVRSQRTGCEATPPQARALLVVSSLLGGPRVPAWPPSRDGTAVDLVLEAKAAHECGLLVPADEHRCDQPGHSRVDEEAGLSQGSGTGRAFRPWPGMRLAREGVSSGHARHWTQTRQAAG